MTCNFAKITFVKMVQQSKTHDFCEKTHLTEQLTLFFRVLCTFCIIWEKKYFLTSDIFSMKFFFALKMTLFSSPATQKNSPTLGKKKWSGRSRFIVSILKYSFQRFRQSHWGWNETINFFSCQNHGSSNYLHKSKCLFFDFYIVISQGDRELLAFHLVF